jgi:ornithine cyclodeaminase/alanine dehydrogenase-like protein (mu-crystallin family)
MVRWRLDEANADVLLLGGGEVAAHLDMARLVEAVEEAFRALGTGAVAAPGVMAVHVRAGAYHVKAGAWGDAFVVKANANFPGNRGLGLPTIQGVVVLFETATGRPLAVLDSAELTARRTGAATGVAVKHLAVGGRLVVTLCGCGRQAASQLEAVRVVAAVERAYVCDVDESAAHALVASLSGSMAIEAVPAARMFEYTRKSQLVITCTTARRAFLEWDGVGPGALVAAVGADNPGKNEIGATLMGRSHVITDLTEQCAVLGDLQHALAARALTREQVRAELGEVIAGKKPGRTSEREVIVFDSTGIALQDVVAARLAYAAALGERAPR